MSRVEIQVVEPSEFLLHSAAEVTRQVLWVDLCPLKAKWLAEEALQIAEKRREAKGKGEKEIYLNAEFQRIARREKKAFLNDPCKEIEGRETTVGKTRDLFKKIRDTKGAFHVKMGSIKDRNGMDLTEVEDIKRRQEYTTEVYRRDLNDPDNHYSIVLT